MWVYEKKLEYPVKIKKPDPRMAKCIITQYGGPDGEIGASLRYLSQRFAMITPEAKATLNDVGSEVSRLTCNNKPLSDIEISRWHFSFAGKMDKRCCVALREQLDKNKSQVNLNGLYVRVLVGLGR